MELDLFDYDLPPERIAQEPPTDRASARLMRLDRTTGATAHHVVRDLPRLLRAGDLLVLNDTAVVPAKLTLHRKSGSRIDGLFLREGEEGRWLVLLNGRGRLKEGEELLTDKVWLALRLERHMEGGQWEAAVECTAPPHTTLELLQAVGATPLPPYIRRQTPQPLDAARYQTVYANRPGAVAAPTAGLHFTRELLDELRAAGVTTAQVTLHVGLGTFEPIRETQIEQHHMHSEWFNCPADTADAVNLARAEGRRVVAVGTTSVRVMESCVADGRVIPRTGWTDLFLYPGCRLAATDAMLTNFHLPRSSLLMLVSAFAGRERILAAYAEAIREGYRFFSYGDCMLIE
ncbi:MAG: S-adenosylmethionine:tRNA ribosyltransferase-isomerase [Phycisphaerae bacterium]|nr:S-adenosylmethionine:tRNA ribosyltransferase-isomerase [Phycisphaerae bacterium]